MLLVIIVSWNARPDLERCLRSVRETPPTVDHRIVVVDNASTDGSADMVAREFPDVALVRGTENLGFARANNAAIRSHAGDPILLLNPDTIVSAGALDRLVEHLASHPEAAAVGPRLVDGSGRAELSSGRLPSPSREAWRKLLTRMHARGVQPFAFLVERAARRPRAVDWVSGAALMVRRGAAEAVGLLDERYGLYWEDIDFCAALRRRGWEVHFTPAAEIVHLRGRSTAKVPEATRRAYRAAQLIFYAKHRPRWLPALRLYQRLRYH